MRSTYAAGTDGRSGLLAHIRPDGRVHPSILLDGAGTGRTSCTDPNLQNIPRPGDEWSQPARDCFLAEEGWELLQVDFSQLELRIAGDLSGDPELLGVYERDEDIHMIVARMVSKMMWSVEPDAVTKEQRAQVKPVVFGKLYGKGDAALARDLKTDIDTARAVIERVFGKFKVLQRWTQERLSESRRSGLAWTYWNGERARRRNLWRIGLSDEADFGIRNTAENSSFNTPIQGTASDYCVASMTELVRWIIAERVPARLCLTVHDALLIEVRKDW
jgi:DNA polymerase-1